MSERNLDFAGSIRRYEKIVQWIIIGPDSTVWYIKRDFEEKIDVDWIHTGEIGGNMNGNWRIFANLT